jgi:DNA modification methylase
MTIQILTGDCVDIMRGLPAESVHCVVTSPPYWGLRDYQIPSSIWGGDESCEHDFQCEEVATEVGRGNWAQGTNGRGELQMGGVDGKREPIRAQAQRGFCRCGAWLGAHGLEPQLNLYVENEVRIFREVWRVLRNDGTLWLNLGDSYAVYRSYKVSDKKNPAVGPTRHSGHAIPPDGLKPKDLCGVPWRVAFALQEDGWYLRQDIIWKKPNPMPESVTDRCTKAHEYLFLLTKSQRYYFDAAAIAEPTSGINDHDVTGSGYEAPGQTPQNGNRKVKMPDGWDTGPGAHGSFHRQGREKGKTELAKGFRGGSYVGGKPGPRQETGNTYAPEGFKRNKRSVWTVASEPFKEAHFATFPPALIEPCILAGCPQDGTVLDPFGGAFTTALVADRLQRNAIMIELNRNYVEIGKNRLREDGGLFLELS